MISVVLFVFNPFINDSRVLKEAISLRNNQFDVTVVAHHDSGLEKYEIVQNIGVKRVSYLDRKDTTSIVLKVLAYFIYLKESIKYAKEFDILHCNDLNTLPIGFIIKSFYNKKAKILYDAHEYETEMNGLSGIKKKIVKILEKFFIRYVDSVITVSNGIANEYVKLYSIKKPSLVLNAPTFKKILKKDLFREIFGINKNQNIFLYQGNLSKGRGIEILIDVFKTMDSKNVIVFMGYGQLASLLSDTAEKCSNIYFHKAVSNEILLNYTCSADFGISTIEDTCLSYHYCLPNKMFEYIMAEVPVIVSNLPEMRKIVSDNNLGIVANSNSVAGLKKAIEEAMLLDKQVINRNLKNAKEIYSWERQEAVLINVCKGLLF